VAATQISWVDAGERRVRTITAGAGRPVVLVHGYGVSGTYMLPLARALAEASFAAYVPDLPGEPLNGAARGGLGIRDLGDALGAWVDAAGLDRPAFVANSMGCQVVTDLAARQPELVGPMVLVGPTVDPDRRQTPRQLIGALRDSAREPLALVALAVRDAGVGIGGLVATARSALADAVEERLPLIEQPAVVVYGDADGFLSRRWAERVAGLLPRGRLVVIPGEPHAVHYTRPGLVASVVGDLLDGQDDSAPFVSVSSETGGAAEDTRVFAAS
jgi:2-hydroxy-6-oxonona-2,4-dienedioate hydrolase